MLARTDNRFIIIVVYWHIEVNYYYVKEIQDALPWNKCVKPRIVVVWVNLVQAVIFPAIYVTAAEPFILEHWPVSLEKVFFIFL